MAKLLCSKSGTYFACEHMPIAFQSSALSHPLFAVPQKRLLSLAGQWAAGKLTKTESYLLFLSLLDSTSLVVWHTHALYTPETDSIVANNMESLIHIIGKIECIKHPNFSLPSFSITRDTASLSNVEHWIEAWKSNYADWYNSVEDSRKADEIKDKIKLREESLQRLIKSSTPPETYATLLADWACVAGAFPTFETLHPVTKTSTTLVEYWKQIIRSVANEDKLWRYPRKDIVELIEHCEDNIAHGNIYSHTLFKYLRQGLARYDNYLGFGDMEVPPASTSFTILPSSASVHQINRAALISTAPESEPLKSQYPSHFAWLKAYTKWKIAKA
jgi:hypothetical protein